MMNCWISSKGASKCNYGNAVFRFVCVSFSVKSNLNFQVIQNKNKKKQNCELQMPFVTSQCLNHLGVSLYQACNIIKNISKIPNGLIGFEDHPQYVYKQRYC